MTRRHPLITLLLVAAAMSWTATALAQQEVDETRRLDSDGTVVFKDIAGTIDVVGWDRDEMKITGKLDKKAEELKITGDAGRLVLEVKYPDDLRNTDKGSRLRLMMPAGGSFEGETVSGDLSVAKLRGDVELETVSGDITVRDEPASVEAATVSGDLDLDVKTDTAELACVSGDIVVKGVRRELECGVVSGEIEVWAGSEMEDLECETVSGDITVTGEMPDGASWSLAAHSGDITLVLTGKVDARFDIETFSGNINDAFGHEARRTSRYAPGRELSFVEGEGKARVEIEAFSGDVRVLKK